MIALRSCPPVIPRVPVTYRRRKISKVCKSYTPIDDTNSRPIQNVPGDDLLHVLSFHQRNAENDGIYAIRTCDRDGAGVPVECIVAFTTFDDAFRYKVLLEAEMSSTPYVQFASPFEIDHVCAIGNYECRVINEGTLFLPPQMSVTATEWECRNALINGHWSVREKDT